MRQGIIAVVVIGCVKLQRRDGVVLQGLREPKYCVASREGKEYEYRLQVKVADKGVFGWAKNGPEKDNVVLTKQKLVNNGQVEKILEERTEELTALKVKQVKTRLQFAIKKM